MHYACAQVLLSLGIYQFFHLYTQMTNIIRSYVMISLMVVKTCAQTTWYFKGNAT